MVARVVADVHERQSGVPCLLADLGVEVEIAPLPVGDYVVARGVLVERKTALHLHTAVVAGTFWQQVGRLRARCSEAYLLIEGLDIDRGPLGKNAVRGVCLAVLEQGVRIIQSSGPHDSALWLARLASRAQLARPRPDRPVYEQRPAAPLRLVPEAVIAAVPGISVVLARRLLCHFGSVRAVVAADAAALAEVEGIGPARATALERAFRSP